MAKHGWSGERFTITRAALEEACQRVGVQSPVEIVLTRYRYQTVGRLAGRRDGIWRITLDATLSAREASRTVYHELAHVVQAERLGGLPNLEARYDAQLRAARLIGRSQRRLFRSRTLSRISLEREAERIAKRWHRAVPLTAP
jgi:hypothetical protein